MHQRKVACGFTKLYPKGRQHGGRFHMSSNPQRWIAYSIALIGFAAALVGISFAAAAFALGASPIAADPRGYRAGAQLTLAQAAPGAPSVAAAKEQVPKHIVEQYKEYVTDLAAIGSQLWTMQSFYLTIVAALIAVLAFKETVRPVQDYYAPAAIVVFIFIVLVSVIWWLTAQQFANLIGAKFEVLRSMEMQYPALYPMFTEQTKHYEAHCTYGVIRHQSWLIVVIGLGALTIAGLGIRWQISNRNAPGAESNPD